MTTQPEPPRVIVASREIAADAGRIFDLIADPAQQPRWDGNENLGQAAAGQRVRRAGDVFMMTLLSGKIRENHVVEFDEGRLIAWTPAEPGQPPPGHLWRWELERPGRPAPGPSTPTTGRGSPTRAAWRAPARPRPTSSVTRWTGWPPWPRGSPDPVAGTR